MENEAAAEAEAKRVQVAATAAAAAAALAKREAEEKAAAEAAAARAAEEQEKRQIAADKRAESDKVLYGDTPVKGVGSSLFMDEPKGGFDDDDLFGTKSSKTDSLFKDDDTEGKPVAMPKASIKSSIDKVASCKVAP